VLATGWPAGAQAAARSPDPNRLVVPRSLERPPAGHRLTGRRVLALARVEPKVRSERRRGRATPVVYLKGSDRWQVSYFGPRDGRRAELAQVTVDDRSGRVTEAWTGFQVPWLMARGYPGAFGRKVNAWYVWVPLCLLFLAPFARPPWRWLHADLLALIGFSASFWFFNRGEIDVSVPLVYPLLLYLLARMLVLARAGRERAPLRLAVPVAWLAVGVVFLLGFRAALNISDSNVIDVGYAGVIGADKLAAGDPLYGAFPTSNRSGDTYGPVTYAAYVPFELVLPWSGRWDDLPAAHAAAIVFDALCVAALWLLGRRLRGPELGVLLAWCWVCLPFTLLVMNTNANDTLVALLVCGSLLAAGSPAGRGALGALGALAKFAPLALAPLLATAGPRPRWRSAAVTLLALGAVGALALAPVWARGDLGLFFDRTLGFQGERGSPFSVWGLYDLPSALQRAAQVLAAGLALAVALVPRRRDEVTLAALAAAVLIALQLAVTHWFYLYLVWFLPALLAAVLARAWPVAQPLRSPAERDAAPARSRRPAPATSS